ncbi:MAG TPA: transposase [Pseudolabrys sp.]|nr:transposase [Pseudolabrys sp.]
MDMHKDNHQVIGLEVVNTGRRRRWTNEAKLRIVEESHSCPRQASATARRHGISNQLLFSWRKAFREGRLGASDAVGFVPVLVEPETTSPGECAARNSGRIEIVSGNGRRIIVDRGVDVATLLRIVRGLETLR